MALVWVEGGAGVMSAETFSFQLILGVLCAFLGRFDFLERERYIAESCYVLGVYFVSRK